MVGDSHHALLAHPTATRPKMFTRTVMSSVEISQRTQKVWDRFYDCPHLARSACTHPPRSRGVQFLSNSTARCTPAPASTTDSARRKSRRPGPLDGEAVPQALPAKPCPNSNPRMGTSLSSPTSAVPLLGRQNERSPFTSSPKTKPQTPSF